MLLSLMQLVDASLLRIQIMQDFLVVAQIFRIVTVVLLIVFFVLHCILSQLICKRMLPPIALCQGLHLADLAVCAHIVVVERAERLHLFKSIIKY